MNAAPPGNSSGTRLFIPAAARPPARPLALPGMLKAARRNMLEIVPEAAYREPLVTLRVITRRWRVVTGPDLLKRVFLDNVGNYPKAPFMHRLLRPYLGESLFLADGEDWRWQRRSMAGMFQRKKLDAMAEAMRAAALRSADRLGTAQGAPQNVGVEMRRLAMEIVRDTMFTDIDRLLLEHVAGAEAAAAAKGDWHDYKSRMDESLMTHLRGFGSPNLLDLLNLPTWLPRPSALFKTHPLEGVRAVMERGIAARRAAAEQTGDYGVDLMALMLKAEDPEDGRRMTDREIRDNLLTFIIAGFETTALALTWSLYLIANDRPTQERLRSEARAALATGSAAEALENLPFAHQVLHEAMRLYPPAPHLVRVAREDDELGGVRIRKGDVILAPIYTLHRHEAVWENPNAFDPERFTPEKIKARHRFAYLPFGAGPRVCIGPSFAMMEASLALATILDRWEVSPTNIRKIDPMMKLTLRPRGGMPLSLTPAPA